MSPSGVPDPDRGPGPRMAERVAAFDWSATPPGPAEQWPYHLKLAARLCLDSGFPLALYWGPDYTLLYNDAWSPIPGGRHPGALGRPAREVWPEVWDAVRPDFERVTATGEAVSAKDARFFLRRHGYTEECYFDYTLSPVHGDGGAVDGLFHAALETTERVLGERRARRLRELARNVVPARSAEEVCARAAEAFAAAAEDVPFALLYLTDPDGRQARLAGAAGLAPGTPASPRAVGLTGADAGPWPLAAAAAASAPQLVADLTGRFGPLPGGAWPEPAGQALVLPVGPARAAGPTGFLVAGVSPRRALDGDYRAFFERAAGHVAAAVSAVDVTARERAERALRESEQRYREVFDYSSECIFLLDVTPEGRFKFAELNPAEEKAVGFASADVCGKFVEDAVPADVAAAVTANYRRCVEAGALVSYEEELNLPVGRRSFQTNLIPVRDASGRVWRIVGVARDVTEHKRAEEALRRSEEILRRAQAIARVGSWTFDVPGGTFVGSEEGYRIVGWGPGTHRAEELLTLVHPDDLARMQAAWERTLEGAPYEIEHRLVVDGQVRWAHVRAEPEADARGRVVRITGVTQDTTERRRGEEALRASLREKEVLLKEVHHRVKNNLQLVSSLLSLQAGQIKDPAAAEAFAESRNRVRVMALVHEDLYRSRDLGSVRLAGHLEALCAHLYRSSGTDPDRVVLELSVADVALDLDRAVRCGLLVNELVSNALKHAFGAGRPGRLAVRLDAEPGGWYTLVVADNGPGLPPGFDPGRSDSLGLQLVGDLTEQLGGTLTLGRGRGTAVTVRFRAAAAGEPQP